MAKGSSRRADGGYTEKEVAIRAEIYRIAREMKCLMKARDPLGAKGIARGGARRSQRVKGNPESPGAAMGVKKTA